MPLVHLDAHIDFGFYQVKPIHQIAEEAKTIRDLKKQLEKTLLYKRYRGNLETQLNIGNYIYPAMREGIINRFYWVIPGDRKKFKSCLNDLNRFVRRSKSQDPYGDKNVKTDNSKVCTNLYGRGLEIRNIFSAPGIEKPILLDIDVDFLLFDSIKNISLTKSPWKRRPWIYPKELVKRIKEKFPKIAYTTISYSVNGGFTPLEYKFFGDEISMRLKNLIGRGFEDIVCLRDKGIAEFFANNFNASVKKFEEAARELKDYKNLDKAFKRRFFAHLYFWLFKIHWKLKEKRIAKEYYQKLLKQDLAYRIKDNNSGPVCLRKNDSDSAQKEFEKIVYCDPKDSFSLCGLAEVFFRRKRYKKALDKYKQALEVNPRHKEAFFGIADCQIRLNRLNKAKKSVIFLKRIKPFDNRIFFLDARLNKKSGNLKKAIASYKEAVISGIEGTEIYEDVFKVLQTNKNDSLLKFFEQRYRGFRGNFYKNQKRMLLKRKTKDQTKELDRNFKRIDKILNKTLMVPQVFLEIAGIKIRVRSKDRLIKEDEKIQKRYESFFKTAPHEKFDIDLEVEATKMLPRLGKKKVLFAVRRNKRNPDWVLSKKDKEFIIEAKMGERYSAIFNEDFTKGKVYLKDSKGIFGWKKQQLIYGPLQVVLIHYLAKHKSGALVHSAGIDYKGEGLLFAGPTKSGKSTLSRLWDKKEEAVILNDDRIIIRKLKNSIYMFGTPWHGDFSDYVDTIAGSTPLKKLFFIYHKKENEILPLNSKEAFNKFFPNTFPVFWDKEDMDFTADFLIKCLKKVPAFSLGFVDDKSAVKHVCGFKQRAAAYKTGI